MKTESSSDYHDRVRIEGIIFSLTTIAIRERDNIEGERLTNDLEPLVTALNEGRWDLIAGAANYMIEDRLPDDSKIKLAEDAKWTAFYLSVGADGITLCKADIIEILRLRYPELYATLPTSKRGMTNWWKEVGGMAEQARGYSTAAVRAYLKSMDSMTED